MPGLRAAVALCAGAIALCLAPHTVDGANACLATPDDLESWEAYGHEYTRNDVTKRCSVPCVREANSASGSQDVFKRCLTKCLSNRKVHISVGAKGPVYTAGCASCFGDWGNCVVKAECASECSNGVLGSNDCQACLAATCDPNFKSCAGHSIDEIPDTGALSTAGLMMGGLFCAFGAYFVLNFTVMKANKFNLYYGDEKPPTKHDPLLLRAAAERQVTKLTSNAIESLRLSVKRMPQGGEPLIAQFPFEAENDDELSVVAGETVTGLNAVDGWWVVRNQSGGMGLVPQNIFESEEYVDDDDEEEVVVDAPQQEVLGTSSFNNNNKWPGADDDLEF